MIHLLASGVFFSGWIKDTLCLPRPLSPPLQRITMSGSAAMEYGFPSTHSTNAVSVALYCLLMLETHSESINPTLRFGLQIAAYFYAFSIVLGRLYCGMHGFLDVIVGSALGAVLTGIQWHYEDEIDAFVMNGTWVVPTLILLVILVLVRVHPEPADDCPCFDDSVAFAGVTFGIELGNWHYASQGFGWNYPSPATIPYSFAELGYVKSILRILFGVCLIVVWRESMKRTLLRYLPPLFRIIQRLGFSLPRRFFIQASDYKAVPRHLKTDSLFPSVSDLPKLIDGIRHPRRRAVSIGPQSAADAYETIHYRQKKRSESISSLQNGEANGSPISPERAKQFSTETFVPSSPISASNTPRLDLGNVSANGFPPFSDAAVYSANPTPAEEMGDFISEQEKQSIFDQLQRPRVRYDVEVVTKLIVYTGIALIAAEIAPILFDVVGLGVGDLVLKG
jgi:hypothetical protein